MEGGVMTDRDGWVPVSPDGWPVWCLAGSVRATVECALEERLRECCVDPTGYTVQPCWVKRERKRHE